MLEMKFFAEVGAVNFFQLSMTKGEILQKLFPSFEVRKNDMPHFLKELTDLTEVEQKINKAILREFSEEPHVIRYFTVPNIDNNTFELFAIAKIFNNGSTFIIGPNKKLLKFYVEDDKHIYNL